MEKRTFATLSERPRGASTAARVLIGVLLAAVVALAGLVGLLCERYYAQYRETVGLRLDPFGLGHDAPGSAAPAALPSQRIVLFGDSRAGGWPAPEGIDPARVVNRGQSAQTTAQLLGRFDRHVAALQPQWVVLQAGINDLKAIPLFPEQKAEIVQRCKANLDALVRRSLDSGARVVVTTVFPTGDLPLERRPVWSDDVTTALHEVNAHLMTLAGERVRVLDAHGLLADAQGLVDARFRRDFLHLNPQGYAVLNRSLAALLATP